MKKLITAGILLFITALALAACGGGQETPQEETSQIADPWIDCASLEEAEELAGFTIAVPDRIEGYPNLLIQAIEKEMIQVFYADGEVGAEKTSTVLIRKGKGSEDISGDYNDYPDVDTASVNGLDVSLKGKDSLVYVAVWTGEGYSYSVNVDKGMSADQIKKLIEQIK